MGRGFVAVLRSASPAAEPVLVEAGASAVLGWAGLATSTAPDDTPAVLLDPAGADPARLAADLAAALTMLAAVDPPHPGPAAVVATVRPVTDTLKLVNARRVLTGTAERDEHRFVITPVAVRLGVLREVARELDGGQARDGGGPALPAVLSALIARGATVLAGTR